MVLGWLLSLFKGKQSTSCLSFSNAPKDKEEYEQRKKQKTDYAFGDFYFWDKLETNLFIKSEEYAIKNICPYCQAELPERKGKSFKCPVCKNKVHKSNDYYSGKEIILTDSEKKEQYEQYEELSKRKKFLEIYQYIDKIIIPVPTIPEIGEIFKQNISDDKNKNIETLLQLLHLGIPAYYQKENRGLNKLRNCRLYEGQIQRLYGTKEQATNAFMSLLYLDLMGDYCELYSDPDFDKDDIDFPEWSEGFIAPGIYASAFAEDLSIEEFEKIFKFNANSLKEQLRFEVPISPNEAWQRVLEFRKSLDNSEKELI